MLKPPSALHHSHSAHHLDLTLPGEKSIEQAKLPSLAAALFHNFLVAMLLRIGHGMIGHVEEKVRGKYFFHSISSVPHTLATGRGARHPGEVSVMMSLRQG